MITIHHLGVSQSDRVVWLMEELGLPYQLKWYKRGEDNWRRPRTWPCIQRQPRR
jgi:glutathione S-transferase